MDNFSITTVQDLGVHIRQIRKKAGLTQANAAGLCGVSIPFFNAIENGKGTAQFNKVLHVCQQLGIKLEVKLPEVD